MNEVFQRFRHLTHRLSDLKAISSILSWDQETMMPSKGAVTRPRQRAVAAAIYHEKLTEPALTDLMDQLEGADLNAWERRSLEEMRREQGKALCLPLRLVENLAETAAIAYEFWVKARNQSDFEHFAPWLEKLIELKREEARCLNVSGSQYEILLDEYEPGMTEASIEDIFAQVRPQLTWLLERITASPVYSGIKRLDGSFPIQTQTRFGREVLAAMGFDWEAGRLDRSPHPFCTGLSPHDVRITTRYSEEDFSAALFGMIHEGGHALYEQGLDLNHWGLPVCEAISLGIHESQSRLWENQIGRSRAFWSHWLPHLKGAFPDQLEDITLDELLLSVNLVKASPVRVTADEVTYGLHIIVRFELERALLNQELDVKSLPATWNDKMESYLGIRPRNDREGVLQDVHWSHGLIGYFPTYLLGNLYSAQLMSQAVGEIRDFEKHIASGDLMALRDWLRSNVHLPGKTLTAEEMIVKVTGQPLNPKFFLEYLENKFGDLYKL